MFVCLCLYCKRLLSFPADCFFARDLCQYCLVYSGPIGTGPGAYLKLNCRGSKCIDSVRNHWGGRFGIVLQTTAVAGSETVLQTTTIEGSETVLQNTVVEGSDM